MMAAEPTRLASPLSSALAEGLRGTVAGDSLEVWDVLPGLAHVHFGSGAPVVRVHCQDGWTTLGAVNVPADPWVLLHRQRAWPNLKFVLVAQDVPRAGAWQLAAEIPVDPVRGPTGDGRWLTWVLIGMQQLLAEPAAAPETALNPAPGDPAETAITSHITDTLTDAGYPFELPDPAAGAGAVQVVIPGRRHPRRIRMTRDGQCWRLELPLGTGDVLLPGKPMREAVGAFLLRAAAAVRFARPCCGQDPGAPLGFEVHLPLQPTRGQLEHGLGAVVTAVERYETEIESLAGEAILSHAFLAIAGDPQAVANQSTYEL